MAKTLKQDLVSLALGATIVAGAIIPIRYAHNLTEIYGTSQVREIASLNRRFKLNLDNPKEVNRTIKVLENYSSLLASDKDTYNNVKIYNRAEDLKLFSVILAGIISGAVIIPSGYRVLKRQFIRKSPLETKQLRIMD